jgi:hypothetical protein
LLIQKKVLILANQKLVNQFFGLPIKRLPMESSNIIETFTAIKVETPVDKNY